MSGRRGGKQAFAERGHLERPAERRVSQESRSASHDSVVSSRKRQRNRDDHGQDTDSGTEKLLSQYESKKHFTERRRGRESPTHNMKEKPKATEATLRTRQWKVANELEQDDIAQLQAATYHTSGFGIQLDRDGEEGASEAPSGKSEQIDGFYQRHHWRARDEEEETEDLSLRETHEKEKARIKAEKKKLKKDRKMQIKEQKGKLKGTKRADARRAKKLAEQQRLEAGGKPAPPSGGKKLVRALTADEIHAHMVKAETNGQNKKEEALDCNGLESDMPEEEEGVATEDEDEQPELEYLMTVYTSDGTAQHSRYTTNSAVVDAKDSSARRTASRQSRISGALSSVRDGLEDEWESEPCDLPQSVFDEIERRRLVMHKGQELTWLAHANDLPSPEEPTGKPKKKRDGLDRKRKGRFLKHPDSKGFDRPKQNRR